MHKWERPGKIRQFGKGWKERAQGEIARIEVHWQEQYEKKSNAMENSQEYKTCFGIFAMEGIDIFYKDNISTDGSELHFLDLLAESGCPVQITQIIQVYARIEHCSLKID